MQCVVLRSFKVSDALETVHTIYELYFVNKFLNAIKRLKFPSIPDGQHI